MLEELFGYMFLALIYHSNNNRTRAMRHFPAVLVKLSSFFVFFVCPLWVSVTAYVTSLCNHSLRVTIRNKIQDPYKLSYTELLSLHEKNNFRLMKICEKDRKDIIFSLVFEYFRFTEMSYFLNFPSNENVTKQHFSASAYFYVNMKFSYKIPGRKDEIYYAVL